MTKGTVEKLERRRKQLELVQALAIDAIVFVVFVLLLAAWCKAAEGQQPAYQPPQYYILTPSYIATPVQPAYVWAPAWTPVRSMLGMPPLYRPALIWVPQQAEQQPRRMEP